MNAATQFADRCVVLHHGKVVRNLPIDELCLRASSHVKVITRSNAFLQNEY